MPRSQRLIWASTISLFRSQFRHPGESRYLIHTSLARHVSAKRRPYTSRPRSGEREGPIAEQWEGEGRPCYLFLRSAAQPDCRHFHEPLRTKGPGAPHPPNADALAPSLSPLSRGEVYRRSSNFARKDVVHTIAAFAGMTNVFWMKWQ